MINFIRISKSLSSLKGLPTLFTARMPFSTTQDICQRRERESQIADILKQELHASFVKIEDTSVTIPGSACGQMYKMVVQSPLFNEKSKVEQHQMVTHALGDLFKDVHGYNLKTLVVQNGNATDATTEENKSE